MEFSNKLSLSLKQDLKVLNIISEEMIHRLSSFELYSWLFPNKSFREVLKMQRYSNSKNQQYLGYLELMIDRLYLLINLMTKYIETFPNIQNEPTPRNVVRPNNLSLGASTNLLWKKLLCLNTAVCEAALTNSRESSEHQHVFQKGTQTDICSSDFCSSCATAISCIKEVIDELETHIEAFSMKKTRQDLQECIYDITQCGCMNRLTTAIREDVKSFIQRSQNLEIQNKQYNTKISDLTARYGETLKMIQKLESSLKKIQKRSRSVRVKNRELLKKINELIQINQENEYKILQESSRNKTFEKSIAESTTSIALLSTDNERLQQDITQTLKENVNALTERDMWKKRFSETYLENRNLKSKLEEFESETALIQNALNKIINDCEKLHIKLEQSNLQIFQKTEAFESLLKSLMEFANSNKTRNVNIGPELTKNCEIFQITGDPIADMKKQVEINTFNMKMLEEHNADLLRTINRVQEKTIPMKLS